MHSGGVCQSSDVQAFFTGPCEALNIGVLRLKRRKGPLVREGFPLGRVVETNSFEGIDRRTGRNICCTQHDCGLRRREDRCWFCHIRPSPVDRLD